MGKVGIVTDSTCDLGPEALRELDVRMVPLKVLFGEETFLDWIDFTPEAFYDKLKNSPVLPKTSQPSPADFAQVYRELADEGCERIISIHLSGPLSGTVSSATMAAEDAPVPVDVIDTRKVCQSVALIVRCAAEARAEGLSGDEIVGRVMEIVAKSRIFFVLDTLEYLVKGGRAGKAAGLAGSLLNIKPILYIGEDGIIAPYKKEKGRRKAFAALAAHIAEESRTYGRLRVRFLHSLDEEGVKALQDEIEKAGADIELDGIGFVGSVIGTYAGPKAVGIAYHPVA